MVLLCPQRAPATTDPCRTPKLGAGPDSLNVIGNCCSNINNLLKSCLNPTAESRINDLAIQIRQSFQVFWRGQGFPFET